MVSSILLHRWQVQVLYFPQSCSEPIELFCSLTGPSSLFSRCNTVLEARRLLNPVWPVWLARGRLKRWSQISISHNWNKDWRNKNGDIPHMESPVQQCSYYFPFHFHTSQLDHRFATFEWQEISAHHKLFLLQPFFKYNSRNINFIYMLLKNWIDSFPWSFFQKKLQIWYL